MPQVVIVFARRPAAGVAKTRLIPVLGANGAAALHRAMVADLLARLSGRWKTVLYTDRQTTDWPEYPVLRRLQSEGDLGTRMRAALNTELRQPVDRAILLGSDSPHIPFAALRTLMDSQADIALGPSFDGGYWGISAKRTHPAMFDGVEWSTDRVLRQTAMSARRSGLSVDYGKPDWDVDDPRDFARLYGHLQKEDYPRTARLLRLHSMCRKVTDF